MRVRGFFTPKEIEVLRLAAMGHRSIDIAAALKTSKRTVDFHLQNIYTKTGSQNRIQALNHAEARAALKSGAVA